MGTTDLQAEIRWGRSTVTSAMFSPGQLKDEDVVRIAPFDTLDLAPGALWVAASGED